MNTAVPYFFFYGMGYKKNGKVSPSVKSVGYCSDQASVLFIQCPVKKH